MGLEARGLRDRRDGAKVSFSKQSSYFHPLILLKTCLSSGGGAKEKSGIHGLYN